MKKLCALFLASLQLNAALVTVCASGCDFTTIQAAIDTGGPGSTQIGCGSVIQVAIETFTGPNAPVITLRHQAGCDKQTVIRGSQQCAAIGQRVFPADASKMPAIRVTTNPTGDESSIVVVDQTVAGANNWTLKCLDLELTSGQVDGALVYLDRQLPVSGSLWVETPSDLAHHIVFDQVIIQGAMNVGGRNNGILANVGHFEVTNSFIETYTGGLGNGTESHAIAGSAAIGPIYLRNNSFNNSQIGTIWGGAKPALMGMRPQGVFFYGDDYYRPWVWRVTDGAAVPTGACLYDARGGESYNRTDNTWYLCVAGSWVLQVGTASPQFYTYDKSQWGTKNMTQVWGEGLLLRNGWYPELQQQHGACFLMNLSDIGELGSPDTRIEFTYLRYNKCMDAPWGVSLGTESGTHNYVMRDIEMTSNMFLNVGALPQSNKGEFTQSEGISTTQQNRFHFGNNTMIMNPGVDTGLAAALNGASAAHQFDYANNITSWMYGGFNGTDSGSGAAVCGPPFAVPVSEKNWSANVIVNDKGVTGPASVSYPIYNLQTDYTSCGGIGFNVPPMFAPNTQQFLSFTSPTPLFNSYQINGTGDYGVPPSSPIYLKGDMRQSQGADVDRVDCKTAGTLAGTPNPCLDFNALRFEPGSTAADLRYLAYNTEACTVTVGTDPDYVPASPEYQAMSSTGDRDRTNAITGLAAHSLHYLLIDCGAAHYQIKVPFWTK